MLKSAKISRYIEGLVLAQGRAAGAPFPVFPWERRFLSGAFAPGIDSAALTVARANGKSTFLAGVLSASVDVGGPLVQPNAEAVLVASSFEQARLTFAHVLRFLAPTLEEYGVGPRGRYRVENSTARCRIEDKETGAAVKVLGSDPRRAHGVAPSLILADEMAQWPPAMLEPMLAALETSRGKIPGSRFLAIGTRPASPDHPFANMLNGGAAYAQIHAAKPDDPPFRLRTWLKANPSLRYMPDLLEAIKREAARAKRDPDRLASFRALRLNTGTSDVSERFLIDPGIWEKLETDLTGEDEVMQIGAPVFGVDLGTNAAQSAVAAYWPTGRLEVLAAFPRIPSLSARGLADGVGGLYEACHRRGELLLLGERVSDVGELLRSAYQRWGLPAAIVCDRWRLAELTEKVEAEFPWVPLVERGMGFKDGAEDVRAFREACLSGMVKPSKSLVMRAAVREGRVMSDPAGNEKLAKGGQGGRRIKARDDALAAAILAVSAGYREVRARAAAPRLQYAIV